MVEFIGRSWRHCLKFRQTRSSGWKPIIWSWVVRLRTVTRCVLPFQEALLSKNLSCSSYVFKGGWWPCCLLLCVVVCFGMTFWSHAFLSPFINNLVVSPRCLDYPVLDVVLVQRPGVNGIFLIWNIFPFYQKVSYQHMAFLEKSIEWCHSNWIWIEIRIHKVRRGTTPRQHMVRCYGTHPHIDDPWPLTRYYARGWKMG